MCMCVCVCNKHCKGVQNNTKQTIKTTAHKQLAKPNHGINDKSDFWNCHIIFKMSSFQKEIMRYAKKKHV